MRSNVSEEFQNDMKEFENRLKQLRAEFNQYLGGTLTSPPNFSVAMIRKLVRKYAGDRTLKGVQKFTYYNLVAKFNTMMEFYNRRLRDKEDGRQTAFGYIKDSQTLVQDAREKARKKMPLPTDKGHIIANVTRQHATLKNMYDKWNEYASFLTTPTPNLDFDQFKKIIAHKTDQLIEQKNCKAIQYKLTVKDGKIKIQAKPIK
ncbi:hypothetical protein JXA80_10605 [bacterium]|nr:hypothetical protein [candidate division CSSED10-310 bacterium]